MDNGNKKPLTAIKPLGVICDMCLGFTLGSVWIGYR